MDDGTFFYTFSGATRETSFYSLNLHSAVLALVFVARRTQPLLSLVDYFMFLFFQPIDPLLRFRIKQGFVLKLSCAEPCRLPTHRRGIVYRYGRCRSMVTTRRSTQGLAWKAKRVAGIHTFDMFDLSADADGRFAFQARPLVLSLVVGVEGIGRQLYLCTRHNRGWSGPHKISFVYAYPRCSLQK